MSIDHQSNSHPYPLFLDVRGKRVLVVGAGMVAERRIETLLGSGAEVILVAPTATPGLHRLAEEGTIRWHRRAFDRDDVDGAVLVFAATGTREVDRMVARAADAAGALVNVADDPDSSCFHVPAIGRRGVVQLAVGTGGNAPALAALLRDRMAAAVVPEHLALAELLGEMRSLARDSIDDPALRMRALAWASRDPELGASIARGERPLAVDALSNAIERVTSGEGGRAPVPSGAFVSIVGAGPGSPDLITVRGLERLRSADIVVYDDLVDRRLLEEAPTGAELIYAGKRGWRGAHGRPGPDSLVEWATQGAGRHLVRLKGGDPSVFGRLDEEIAALVSANVPFEIVPGVTAALAAAAAAHMPLTARGVSSSVTLAAAIASGGEDELVDLLPLVKTGGTVVVYMGLRVLPRLVDTLLASGVVPATPATVVSGASTPAEQVLHSCLERVVAESDVAALASPAVVIIGQVAEKGVAHATAGTPSGTPRPPS